MADKVAPTVAQDGALTEAIVRRGHVVWGPRSAAVTSGPGQKVLLPAKTAAKLRATGVLYDPQVPEIPVGLGPNFNIEDGVQMKPAPDLAPTA